MHRDVIALFLYLILDFRFCVDHLYENCYDVVRDHAHITEDKMSPNTI